MERMSHRAASVDACRGIAMVLMVLDHTRDYLSNYPWSPTDLSHPDAGMFFMRFVTHFCAPWFVLLAGVGVGLSLAGGKPRTGVSRFLLIRGIWLVVAELVIIRLGCFFDYVPGSYYLGVIWALGMAMICLSALIRLPVRVLGMMGLTGILCCNLPGFLSILPSGGIAGIVSFLVFKTGTLQIGRVSLAVDYPFGVWTLLAMTGMPLARLWSMELAERVRLLRAGGIILTLLFLVLRICSGYGDPTPFAMQDTFAHGVLAFLNTEKYPPSLHYLLMTTGPLLLLLAIFEQYRRAPEACCKLGQVPLFFYMVHFPVINTCALLWYCLAGHFDVLNESMAALDDYRPDFGFHPAGVVLWWMVFVTGMYFLSARYGRFKQGNGHRWWVRYV